MNIDKTTAIASLEPSASFSVYENDRIEWNSSDITQPTDDEINAEVTRLQGLEPMRLLREERNILLAQSDWMANSDVTMSDEWKTYRQALRDLPKTHPVNYGDPKLDSNGKLDMGSITWPTSPS